MSAPESHTSADQALSSFMGAAIGAPDSDFAPNQPATDEKQIARWKRDSELLDAIQSACWDVRFISHSNGDDYSIGIEIVSHFMQRPCKRVIGENWNENLRAALEQAMTADPYPPARPERHAPAAGDARDAERYRWLCDKFGVTKLPCAIERIVEGKYVADGKESIDAAIDAAIAAQQGKGGE
jgi:hypothetical protein